MLGVFICKKCGLVQLKNPAKLKQQLKEQGSDHLLCPKCNGEVTEADVSYADYVKFSEEEREVLIERYRQTDKIKKIFITGAGGQLGHALNKLLAQQQKQGKLYEVYNTSRMARKVSLEDDADAYPADALDITSEQAVKAMIEEKKPDIIINCAAFTSVDLCETQEEAAYAMNALGPKYLAEAAKAVDAVLIHVSTDYVFSGEKESAYLEEDETSPQSAYGRTKLAGEQFVAAVGGKYFIVRTAWLYGEGKNFVRTMLKLSKERDCLTVVDDQTGTPTSADELAKAILFLSEQAQYGIYHATCEGEATWYEFAKKIFAYAGQQVKVVPVTSEEYKTPAKRPKHSVLENRKLNALSDFRMKSWEDALKEYIDALS